jgi:hypothetical protein
MKKTVSSALFIAGLLAACSLILTCGDGKGKGSKGQGAQGQAAEESQPDVWDGPYDCKKGDAKCRDDNSLGDGLFFGGTVYNTVVSADVNVRSAPSTKGEILFQLTKGTKVQVLGATKDGWAYVAVRDFVPRRGWLFKSVEYGETKEETITPAELKITGFKSEPGNFTSGELTGSYTVGGEEKTVTIRGYKEKEHNFYTFFYDIFVAGSRYSNPPGLYTWQHTNNRLTYRGPFMREPYNVDGNTRVWEIAMFTDDFKYYAVTESDGNQLIFKASDNKRVLSDVSVMELDLRAKAMKCECPSDALVKKDFPNVAEMDEQLSEYKADYEENNPRPDGALSLRVICTLNLDTGARKILEAGWLQ